MDFSSQTAVDTRLRLIARFGSQVEAWWERLPRLLAQLAERWDVVLGDPVGSGNTSLVVRSQRPDGRAAVLKLTPEAGLGVAEASALRRRAPSGGVPVVWDSDAASGALLLEAIPGDAPLAEPGASVELEQVADLIDRLHRSGQPGYADCAPSLTTRVDFIFDHWTARNARAGEAVGPDTALRRCRELAQRRSTGFLT